MQSIKSNLNFWGCVVGFILASVSCTEKIDLKLKNAEPQLVIEGLITDEPYALVAVSRTSKFDEKTWFEGVDSAVVIMSDDVGNADTMQSFQTGIFTSTKLQGTPGRTYFLKVIHNGKVYSATSTMPQKVEIDSIKIETSTGSFMNPESKRLRGVGYFKDPAGVSNYYKIEALKNGKYQFSNNVSTDRLWDGKQRTFFVPSDTLTKGDTLTARLLSIDSKVFEYFLVLRDLNSLFNRPAAPANPPSNISPPALGYFSAHSISIKTVIVE